MTGENDDDYFGAFMGMILLIAIGVVTWIVYSTIHTSNDSTVVCGKSVANGGTDQVSYQLATTKGSYVLGDKLNMDGTTVYADRAYGQIRTGSTYQLTVHNLTTKDNTTQNTVNKIVTLGKGSCN